MKNIEKEIQKMRVSDEAKNFLIKTNKLTDKNNLKIKKVLPHIILIGDMGSGISEFTKKYESVLRTNKIYIVRGNNSTYLNLIFPKDGSLQDYEKFYKSPEIVTPTQKEFQGVFVISFQEWKGNDLLESEHFDSLMRFVDAHKEKINFVFHLKTDFSNKNAFIAKLRKFINCVTLKLVLPDLIQATEYVHECLENQGINLSQNTKEAIRDLIVEKIDINSSAFQGYITLQRFAENIQYELFVDGDMNLNTAISADVIKRIENNIICPTIEIESKRGKIGFCC